MEVIDISLPAMRRVDAEVPSAIMGGETEVGAVGVDGYSKRAAKNTS